MEHRVELDGDSGVHSETGLQAPECFYCGRSFWVQTKGAECQSLDSPEWHNTRWHSLVFTCTGLPQISSSAALSPCKLALSCSLGGK